LERIDCVELVGAERESARYFLPENGGVVDDPRLRLIIADGRNHLLTTTHSYDVISFNAIHPAYSPYLYTKEFYQLCRDRLSEQGVVCAWIPTNSAHFPSLLRTFHEVFPHATVWWANPAHLAMIGGRHGLEIDFPELRRRMSPPQMQRNLAETHLEDPVRLVSHFLMDADAVSRFVADEEARVNTDDLPHVGYQSREEMKSRASAVANARLLLRYHSSPWPLVRCPGSGAQEVEELRMGVERCCESGRLVLTSWVEFWGHDPYGAMRRAEEAVAVCPDDARAVYRRAMVWASPGWDKPAFTASALAARREREMRAAIAAQEVGPEREVGLPPRYFTVIRVELSRMLMDEGRLEEAKQMALEILEYEPGARAAEALLAEIEGGRAR
jgi:hypothetical protein